MDWRTRFPSLSGGESALLESPFSKMRFFNALWKPMVINLPVPMGFLTCKLCSVIDRLVSHTQSAFIRGRSIYHGWVIASEVLDVMKRKNEGIIFKLVLRRPMIGFNGILFSSPCGRWDLASAGLGGSACALLWHSSLFGLWLPGPRFLMKCVLC